jgi:hypothetical protein
MRLTFKIARQRVTGAVARVFPKFVVPGGEVRAAGVGQEQADSVAGHRAETLLAGLGRMLAEIQSGYSSGAATRGVGQANVSPAHQHLPSANASGSSSAAIAPVPGHRGQTALFSFGRMLGQIISGYGTGGVAAGKGQAAVAPSQAISAAATAPAVGRAALAPAHQHRPVILSVGVSRVQGDARNNWRTNGQSKGGGQAQVTPLEISGILITASDREVTSSGDRVIVHNIF